MQKIKVAIAGVGNCASSLVQGFYYYMDKTPEDAIGIMHWEIGGYKPSDIQVVAAIDIDKRKVGRDISEAIFAPPNCTQTFFPQVPHHGVSVRMGAYWMAFLNICKVTRNTTPLCRLMNRNLIRMKLWPT